MRNSSRCALLAVLCLLLVGCAGGGGADQDAGSTGFVSGDGSITRYQQGDRPLAPAVTGESLDGGRLSLRDYRGTVVVLNFWGSWCAPCRAEAAELVTVAEATYDAGVRFIGVNVRDSQDKAAAFDRTYRVPYPSIFDPAGRVALAFRDTPPNAIPATIVIDRNGGVAAVLRKPVTAKELNPVVSKVASESERSS
ncbi:MAG: TlpA family protein disulfide reductase [Mycobacteriales bacterium]